MFAHIFGKGWSNSVCSLRLTNTQHPYSASLNQYVTNERQNGIEEVETEASELRTSEEANDILLTHCTRPFKPGKKNCMSQPCRQAKKKTKKTEHTYNLHTLDIRKPFFFPHNCYCKGTHMPIIERLTKAFPKWQLKIIDVNTITFCTTLLYVHVSLRLKAQ